MKGDKNRDARRLFTVKDIMREYGFGRQAATKIMMLIPHLKVGVRRYAYMADVEAVVEKLMRGQLDLNELIRERFQNESNPEDEN